MFIFFLIQDSGQAGKYRAILDLYLDMMQADALAILQNAYDAGDAYDEPVPEEPDEPYSYRDCNNTVNQTYFGEFCVTPSDLFNATFNESRGIIYVA